MSKQTTRRAGRGALKPAPAELFESVFNSVHTLMAYMDRAFKFVRVNKAYAEANGVPPGFFTDKRYFEIFSPDGEADFKKVVETGETMHVYEQPFALLGPNEGKTRYWDWSLAPVRDQDDDIIGLVLMLVDVTDRRRAKEALRISEEDKEEIITDRERVEKSRTRLAAAIEQAAESVSVIDKNGVIRYVNPAFVKATGYSASEILGANLLSLDGDFEAEASRRARWATIAKGEVWRGRSVRKRKDGQRYQVESFITPLRDPDDESKVEEYIVTERDISREVSLEKQLRQTQKMEALGILAGGIAHDLNNILMPIIMNAEMITEDVPEESPLHHFASKVLSSAHRGRNLVRRILTFSREKDAEKKIFSVAQPVEEALDLVRPTLLSTVTLEQHISPDTGQVVGDPAEIQEMIVNLCSNAAHAVGVEKGLIDVRLENVTLNETCRSIHSDLRPGRYVRLSIRDTGVGMDDGLQERIFDPFFTTKKPREGTGMGLAMVHGAVRRHGGVICVSSRPEHGSTFEIYLPRVAAQRRESKSTRPIPRGNREWLLLVDDEKDIIDAAKNVLSRLGYRVSAEQSGKAALETFRRSPDVFDLAILDYALPQMTGLDLARRLREVRADIPIVLATGFSGAIDPGELEVGHIQAVISKPLTSREVGETIDQILKQDETVGGTE